MSKIDYQLFLKRREELKEDDSHKADYSGFESELSSYLQPTRLSNSSLAEQLRHKVLKES